jgi:hypothetical protein
VCPFFKKIGFTPNGITTLSLIFGIASAYYLYKGKIYMFALLYTISYFFDVMDGHFARKYKMVSKGGDYYDNVIKQMKGGIPIIYSGFIYSKKENIRGIPDLLVRNDYISSIFKTIPEIPVEKSLFGMYYYIPIEIKYSTIIGLFGYKSSKNLSKFFSDNFFCISR